MGLGHDNIWCHYWKDNGGFIWWNESSWASIHVSSLSLSFPNDIWWFQILWTSRIFLSVEWLEASQLGYFKDLKSWQNRSCLCSGLFPGQCSYLTVFSHFLLPHEVVSKSTSEINKLQSFLLIFIFEWSRSKVSRASAIHFNFTAQKLHFQEPYEQMLSHIRMGGNGIEWLLYLYMYYLGRYIMWSYFL